MDVIILRANLFRNMDNINVEISPIHLGVQIFWTKVADRLKLATAINLNKLIQPFYIFLYNLKMKLCEEKATEHRWKLTMFIPGM